MTSTGPDKELLGALSRDATSTIVGIAVSSMGRPRVAEIMGVTPSMVSKYVHGKSKPPADRLARLLEEFDKYSYVEALYTIFEDLLHKLLRMVGILSYYVEQGFEPPPRVVLLLREVDRRLEEL